MPEIDRGLFQVLTLGGLLLLIILMSLVLGTLRRIAARTSQADAWSRELDVVRPVAAPSESDGGGQPFEQNGRWFFHRGGELLVYEETTGEWLPTETATEREPEPILETDQEREPVVAVAVAEPGTNEAFWKCPTCAAVNSLSAATCRMCFSAKP